MNDFAFWVAMQILDIFLLFGAPNILQSDNGAEFTASIISQLKDLWPECKIVHGKPRHPQSQGSVERANADIRDMTVTWMHENSCKVWQVGIKCIATPVALFDFNDHRTTKFAI
jgi:transposase InsO family protein